MSGHSPDDRFVLILVRCPHCAAALEIFSGDEWYDHGWCPTCGTLCAVDTFGEGGEATREGKNLPGTILSIAVPHTCRQWPEPEDG